MSDSVLRTSKDLLAVIFQVIRLILTRVVSPAICDFEPGSIGYLRLWAREPQEFMILGPGDDESLRWGLAPGFVGPPETSIQGRGGLYPFEVV